MKRSYAVGIRATVDMHATLDYKARSPGRRPFAEGRVGASLHKLSGVWNHLERVIRRDSNLYRETITDPKTGRVIRHVEHPLTDHKGHGADKGPRTPDT